MVRLLLIGKIIHDPLLVSVSLAPNRARLLVLEKILLRGSHCQHAQCLGYLTCIFFGVLIGSLVVTTDYRNLCRWPLHN